jgi:molybdenum cofactor cytidylyltransferase
MTNALELHAIVLAAGRGSRFGGRKLLAPWNDGVLLDGALAAAMTAPVAGIVVVTGADADDVAASARGFAASRGEDRLTIVHAADFGEGMAASLRTGISHLPPSAAGAFIFLGDMPRIPLHFATASVGTRCSFLALFFRNS